MIFASDNISCFIFSKRNDNATIVFIFFNFFISFNFPKGIDNATIVFISFIFFISFNFPKGIDNATINNYKQLSQ